MLETVKIRSNVKVIVEEEGKPTRIFHAHNTWDTAGLNVLRDFLAYLTVTPITHIAWVDTGGTERARDLVTQRVYSTDATLMIRQYLPSASPANGYTLNTLRAYNAASGGDMFAEVEFDPSGVAKSASVQITVEWTHEFADGGV